MENIKQMLKDLTDQNEKNIEYGKKRLKFIFVLNSILILVFSIGFIQQYGFNMLNVCLLCTSLANSLYGFIFKIKD